jgi:hypothetical protein
MTQYQIIAAATGLFYVLHVVCASVPLWFCWSFIVLCTTTFEGPAGMSPVDISYNGD